MNQVNQLVINYHITEKCNYDCHYCYAKWAKPNEIHRNLDDMKTVLSNLAEYFLSPNPIQKQLQYQSVRLNFAGGEPLLLKQRFIDALDYAIKLGFKTSIITNGHLITDQFIVDHSHKLQLLGISYDSYSIEGQQQIGRITPTGKVLSPERLQSIFKQVKSQSPTTELKINTVVNQYNTEENFTDLIAAIQPNKWKVLRVLPVFDSIQPISNQQFNAFVDRHQSVAHFMSAENNNSMTNSYLMLSPDGAFFQNGNNEQGYFKSRSLLTTPVDIALAETGFDAAKFAQRYQ
ncbi:radical SAM protein [Aliivibrio sp. 1S165]|uniref:viperin family antiviral radical SAM protein n=1 Tax=unclassified Aliivibrio TaxID=2645654 RepID=UPI00080E59FE|nr:MULTISPECIES: viperin family antiviral radical SAM protein [unclassified Aliivibrio]OCH16462.1 radical SAM protein [Aliivibrio sp. 1S165]OCH33899.1 radical SAM protein [Aliivibrio sp. 1S175]